MLLVECLRVLGENPKIKQANWWIIFAGVGLGIVKLKNKIYGRIKKK
jgi:hypothetical protein